MVIACATPDRVVTVNPLGVSALTVPERLEARIEMAAAVAVESPGTRRTLTRSPMERLDSVTLTWLLVYLVECSRVIVFVPLRDLTARLDEPREVTTPVNAFGV